MLYSMVIILAIIILDIVHMERLTTTVFSYITIMAIIIFILSSNYIIMVTVIDSYPSSCNWLMAIMLKDYTVANMDNYILYYLLVKSME